MKVIKKACLQSWQEHRFYWERRDRKSHIVPQSYKSYSVNRYMKLLKLAMKPKQIRSLCERLSQNIEVNHNSISFDGLHKGIDGFRILHLSDFHIDCNPNVVPVVSQRVPKEEFDLVLFTGDYQDCYNLSPSKIQKELRQIIESIQSRHGIIATLGNHDSVDSKKVLEDLGCRVLINESVELLHNGAKISVTGLDDVHSFYSDSAIKALDIGRSEGFSILAVHSPEIYQEAASAGYNLYLCGHTHGGQVCLPGQIPLVSHARAPMHMTHGIWNYQDMIGYTNKGFGTSGLPLRLFCPGEISIHTLRNHSQLQLVENLNKVD